MDSGAPTSVTTVTTGFGSLNGCLYDGSHIWVTDSSPTVLRKLNSNGSIAQTIQLGLYPQQMVFDGTNIWIPHNDFPTVTVVRVKDAGGNPLTSAFVLANL